MNQLRILQLAMDAALERWGRFNEELQEMPDNKIRQIREKNAYEEMNKVRDLLLAEEQKAKENEKEYFKAS